jgi:hypothetical protein
VKFDPKNVSFVVFKLKKKRYKPKFSELWHLVVELRTVAPKLCAVQ